MRRVECAADSNKGVQRCGKSTSSRQCEVQSAGGPEGLSGMHPADLLGTVQKAALDRSGVPAEAIGQVVGGCVSQVGEQTFNIARIAWLSQGLPMDVAATTVDSQCGSSQQATTLAAGLVGSGLEDVVLVVRPRDDEPRSARRRDEGRHRRSRRATSTHYQPTSQFGGAEMIGNEYGITRAGRRPLRPAQPGARRPRVGREALRARGDSRRRRPALDQEGKPTGEIVRVVRDEGLRKTSLEKLAALAARARPEPAHRRHVVAGERRRSRGDPRLRPTE